jgi:hypothetical protein
MLCSNRPGQAPAFLVFSLEIAGLHDMVTLTMQVEFRESFAYGAWIVSSNFGTQGFLPHLHQGSLP